MKKNNESVVHYDKDVDVLYIVIKKGPEESVIEAAPGINVEFDASGKVIGIEILDASKNLRAFAKAVAVREGAESKPLTP